MRRANVLIEHGHHHAVRAVAELNFAIESVEQIVAASVGRHIETFDVFPANPITAHVRIFLDKRAIAINRLQRFDFFVARHFLFANPNFLAFQDGGIEEFEDLVWRATPCAHHFEIDRATVHGLDRIEHDVIDVRELFVAAHFEAHANPEQVFAEFARRRHVFRPDKRQIARFRKRMRPVADVEIRPDFAVPVFPDEFLIAEILFFHLSVIISQELFVFALLFESRTRLR